MNARALKKAAKDYQRLTGLDPVRFKGCSGTTDEKHQELRKDVIWYRVHTEDIAQRLNRAVR